MDLLNSIHVINVSPSGITSFKRTLRDALFRRDIADWILRIPNEGLLTRLRYLLPLPLAAPCPRL